MAKIRRSKTNNTYFTDIPKLKNDGGNKKEKGKEMLTKLIIENARQQTSLIEERKENNEMAREARKAAYNNTVELHELQGKQADLLENYLKAEEK